MTSENYLLHEHNLSYTVSSVTLNPTIPYHIIPYHTKKEASNVKHSSIPELRHVWEKWGNYEHWSSFSSMLFLITPIGACKNQDKVH